MENFNKAKKNLDFSVGESVRIVRITTSTTRCRPDPANRLISFSFHPKSGAYSCLNDCFWYQNRRYKRLLALSL